MLNFELNKENLRISTYNFIEEEKKYGFNQSENLAYFIIQICIWFVLLSLQ